METIRSHPALYWFRGPVEACPMRNGAQYFPEGYLAEYLHAEEDELHGVWASPCVGVNQLRSAYQKLVDEFKFDTVILVDGGVDSIMRGDEEGRATLVEDTVSLAAVAGLTGVENKILACLGFGTEYDDGLCHYRALENMAGLVADGAALGGCQVVKGTDGFDLMRDAYRYAEQRGVSSSHIAPRIIRAVEGEFEGGDPFVQPLMSQYWFWDVEKVLARNLIAQHPMFARTNTWDDVTLVAGQATREAQQKGLRRNEMLPL